MMIKMKRKTIAMTMPQPMAITLLPMHMRIMPSITFAGSSNIAIMNSDSSISMIANVIVFDIKGISISTQYMIGVPSTAERALA